MQGEVQSKQLLSQMKRILRGWGFWGRPAQGYTAPCFEGIMNWSLITGRSDVGGGGGVTKWSGVGASQHGGGIF